MKDVKDVKIKYNDTFGTIHSRDYYKGKSFHYAGEWTPGVHYFGDDYDVDFIVKNNCLLACKKSHFSTLDNEPKNFLYDTYNNPIGITSRYWSFVIAGRKGTAPKIKVEDGSWWISYTEGSTWEKLIDLTEPYWNDETDFTIELSVNNIRKTLLKNIPVITEEDIDELMAEFNILAHG